MLKPLQINMSQKKSYQKYDKDTLESALSMVRAGEASQRAAAKRYGIPQATLSDHLRGRTKLGT